MFICLHLRGKEAPSSPEGRSHSTGKGSWCRCRRRSAASATRDPRGTPGVAVAWALSRDSRGTQGTSCRAPSLPPTASSPGPRLRGPRPPALTWGSAELRPAPQQLPAPPAPPSGPAASRLSPALPGPALPAPASSRRERWARSHKMISSHLSDLQVQSVIQHRHVN